MLQFIEEKRLIEMSDLTLINTKITPEVEPGEKIS